MVKSLIKDTAIYGATDFICKFLNFAIFPILAYVLTVAEFGLYTLLTVQAWLMIMLVNCGMHHSLERYYLDKSSDEVQKSKVVSSGLVGLVFLSCVWILPAIYLTYTLRNETEINWKLLTLAMSSAFPTVIFHFICHVFRMNFYAWRFTFFHSLQNILALLFGFYLIFKLHWGVAGLLWGQMISFLVLLPFAFLALFTQFRWSFDLKIVKSLLSFGLPFMFTDIARWIYGLMDRWLLDRLASVTEVGLFSMSFKLATLLIFMMNAFALAWNPFALKAHNEDPNHPQIFSRCFTWWLALLSLGALGLNFFGLECLMLLTPPDYWPAASILPLISAGLVLQGTTQISGISFFIKKKNHHFTISAWVGAFVNCVLNFYLIPLWGAHGAALATLATYALLATYMLIFSQRVYKIPIEYSKLCMCLAVLFLGTCAFYLLNAFNWSLSIFFCKVALWFLALSLYTFFDILNLFAIFGYFRTRVTVS